MRHPGLIGACWPSPFQEDVLRVAVGDRSAVGDTWARLRPRFVLDDLVDDEVHRLLPLVHAQLLAAGVEDPDLPRLRGIHRRFWYQNQLLLHRARPGLDPLRDAGIPLLFLKGVPLGLTCYADLGLRPMHDIDVLVPDGRVDEALDLLESRGWRDPSGLPRERLRRTHHGAGLAHPDGGQIDLHWHLGTPLLLPGDEAASTDDLWTAAVPLRAPAHGIDDLTLCPTDHLLHVIAHGLWAGSASTVRWAADAATLIRSGAIDWPRLTEQAGRRRLSPLVADALRFLRDHLDAPVPEDPIQELGRVPTTGRERRLLHALTGPVAGPDVLGGLPHLRSYWAYTRLKWPARRAARELPGFVAELWDLDGPWQIPVGAARRARARLTGLVRADRPVATPRPRSLPPPTIAVVVPTHHRAADLQRCLDALAAQQDRPEEVIVVRGPDDEDAAAVLDEHRDEVTEVVVPASQVARLHAGTAAAGTDIVAFTDDDATPHVDWVARLRGWFQDPTVGAVGGRDRQPNGDAAGTHRRIGQVQAGGRVVGGHAEGTGPARDVVHLRGVNLAVRRPLARFPVGLRGTGAQGYNELPLCLWVRAGGHRVVYDPRLLVDHHLAPRHDQGVAGRGAASTDRRAADAYNQTYALVSLGATRWWARLLYVALLGDRSTGGLVRCLAARLSGDRQLANERRPLLRAHLDAVRDARQHPLRGVGPDEAYPA